MEAKDLDTELVARQTGQTFREQMVTVASAVPGLIYSFRIGADGVWSMPFSTPAIYEIFGVTPEQVVAEFASLGELLHPDDFDRVRDSILESAQTMLPWRQEFRVRHPRRGLRWIEGNSTPFRQADGSILWHGYMQDITDRKANEEALHYQNEMLTAQLEASIDGILVVNTDGSLRAVNRRFTAMWGMPQDLIDRHDHSEMLAFSTNLFADPEAFAEGVRRQYENPSGLGYDELPMKDGRVIERHSAPLFAQDGRLCGRLWTFRDITEARKAQQALLKAEQFARETSDSLSAHIAILDREGTIIATNRAWDQFALDNQGVLAAVPANENYIQVCERVVGPEQEQARAFAQGIREVLSGRRETFSLEYPCHSPTENRWFVGRITRFAGEDATRLVIAHENITDRVLALNASRERKALLTEMERTAKIGGWEVDLVTGSTMWTDEVTRIYGVETQDHLSANGIMEFYAGESRTLLQDAWNAAVATGQPFDLELELNTRDGVRKWVRAIGHPHLKDGTVTRISGALQDISDKKKVELALRDSEALFSTVFRVSPIAINIFRLADGRSIDVNEQYLVLTGFTRDEVIGHTAAELKVFADPDARSRLTEQINAASGTAFTEIRIRCKSGEIRDALASLNVVTLNGEGAAIVVATDITERKSAEAEMKALQGELLHAQKMEAVGLLAGGVAHDFNNLLQVINSYSSKIVEKYGQEESLLRYARSIQQAGEIAADLTRQLLVFSRKAPAQQREVELDAVLAGMDDMMRGLLGETITVQLELKAAGGYIVVDPSQIQQILLNLAVNARDAMPKGGALRIVTSLKRSDNTVMAQDAEAAGTVELAVSDSGHGMDVETLKRVFEPFFTTKPMGRGTGLGLSTVYGIVQQCGGRVDAESQPGVGTTFRMSFPRAATPEVPAVAGVVSPELSSKCILVVEDAPDLRELYTEVLLDHGCRVLSAENGRVALELIERTAETIDLIVSDNMMPLMTGTELFETLKRTRPHLKLLLMSGNPGERRSPLEGEREVDLLAKPFSMATFVRKVQALLDGAPA